MLDDTRTRLKRSGMLQTSSAINKFLHNEAQRDLTTSSFSDSAPQSNLRAPNRQPSINGIFTVSQIQTNGSQIDSIINEALIQNKGPQAVQNSKKNEKTFIQRTLRNLLSQTMIELSNTDINFYQYQDQNETQENDHKNDSPVEKRNSAKLNEAGNSSSSNNQYEDVSIDQPNIRKYYQSINRRQFLLKNLCFRLNIPDVSMKVNAISDEDIDFQIMGSRCLMVNPCFSDKQGVLEDINILMKLPIQTKMLKFLGNYDISFKVRKANLDLNKTFIKKIFSWFTGVYTLNTIIKAAKNIILKTHYMDEILKRQNDFSQINQNIFQEGTNKDLSNVQNDQVIFENYRDTMIPKRFKIQLVEGINLIISDKCKKLSPFLDHQNGNQEDDLIFQDPNEEFNDPQQFRNQRVFIKLEKTTFELLRKIQNTYYIIVRLDNGELSINQNYDAFTLKNFIQEVDFTLRREVTNLPVKRQRLILDNKIKLESINMNISASFFNWILQVKNIMKQMVFDSSVKSEIINILLSEEFLKNNVLQINQQKQGTQYEKNVLCIFKQLKFQDEIQSSIKLLDLKLKTDRKFGRKENNQFRFYQNFNNMFGSQEFQFMKQNEHKSQSQILAEQRECLLKYIFLQLKSVNIQNSTAAGQVIQQINFESIILQPIHQYQSIKQQNISVPPQPLFSGQNINISTITHLGQSRHQLEQYINADKIHLNVNFEVFLDISDTIIDFQIINKHYQQKWNSKYKQPLNLPKDIVERNAQIQDLKLKWNLSSSRIISLEFQKVQSQNEYFTEYINVNGKPQIFKYVQKQGSGQQKLILKSKEGKLVHYRYINDKVHEFYRCCFVPIENHLITKDHFIDHESYFFEEMNNEMEVIQETLVHAHQFQLRFDQDDNNVQVQLSAVRAHFDLPDNFHFIGMIYEIDKQWFHGKEWYRVKTEERILCAGYQSNYQQNSCDDQSSIQSNILRGLIMCIKVQDIEFSVKENSLKKQFIDKNEVIEILTERGYYRVRQDLLEQYLREYKNKNLNYLYIKGKNYMMQYEIPKIFKSKEYILDLIKSLDEARDFIKSDTFVNFKPGIHTFKFDYAYLIARNMKKPILEMWRVYWNQTFIAAELNTSQNPSLFTSYLRNKIFQRFELPKYFNRLLSKWFYDTNIEIHKVRLNIQGQQSLLFFNDFFQQVIAKFIWEDISRGRDPNKKYLKYLMGVDRSRARMHGRFKISALNTVISIYSKRNFNRFDHYFQIIFSDYIFHQVYQKQQMCMRNFLIKKEPLLQFETLFLKVPIIELKYHVIFNEGINIDHYFNQQNVRDHQDWLNRVEDFIQKNQNISIQINIPSLGQYNESEQKCLYLPLLLQSYTDNSLIPVIHYQHSHMQNFDEFIKEFQTNRIDISSKVYRKIQFNNIGINKRYTVNYLPKKLQKSKTKFQCQISDFILILSDFKEKERPQMIDIYGELNIDDELLSPDEINDHTKKDQYLSRYNGLMITSENLCVQSEFTYKPNHADYFKINDSLASFEMFRLSKLTSVNLFNLRHPSFNIYRNIQKQEKTINTLNF